MDSGILQPHCLLPKPEPPRPRPVPPQDTDYVLSLGKLIRDRSNSFSAAIAKRIFSDEVTEFDLSGVTVVVKLKDPSAPALRGRISFFSRSNCRDCTAVRRFLREKGVTFVEINVDIFPEREEELLRRTGAASVPQIFFNEKLFGGLVALNSLRNSGTFDARLREMLAEKCPDHAPSRPLYGFDHDDDERCDGEMVEIVRVLRQRLPIQDRLIKMKMKMVKNCFAGAEMTQALINYLDCAPEKAVEMGKQLAEKHFIRDVFGEKYFEDGNHLYRFLEHEPFIPKCYNFRGSMNDRRPKPAAVIGEKLTKIMSAILEAYSSDDRRHVDYVGISNSEEFRRYVNLTEELHRVDLGELSEDERMAFFMNLYNAMAIHAVIRVGPAEGIMDRRFFNDFQYVVGGHPYSLTAIKNGILRCNRRPPYFLVKPFGSEDPRSELAVAKLNPLIHFGLCDGTRSSPTVRFFSAKGIETELRSTAREFFQGVGMDVDLEKRVVHLTRIIKWFDSDFGQEKEIMKWVMKYLDATKAGLLTHLMSDGGPINISFNNYDWSVNSF